MIFDNRTSAGKMLSAELVKKNYTNPHIFALVRGGVPVALEVAKVLKSPLDAIVVRKLGIPSFPELGFGAIAPDDTTEIDKTIIFRYRLHVDDIYRVKKSEMLELLRRMDLYGIKEPGDLGNETAVIIDDGLATGISMIAAVKYLKTFNPKKIVVAVPVCPDTSRSQFRGLVDEFICLDYEESFGAVGEFYSEFSQVSDEEVIKLLNEGKTL